MPTKLQTDRIAWLRVLAMLAAGVVTAITTNVISGNDGDGNARTDCLVDFCAADEDVIKVLGPDTARMVAEGTVTSEVATGGVITADTAGVQLTAASGSDDVTITAADAFNVTAAASTYTAGSGTGAAKLLFTDGSSPSRFTDADEAQTYWAVGDGLLAMCQHANDDITLQTTGGGDDIFILAGDDISVTGDALTSSLTGSWQWQTPSGGTARGDAGGLTFSALSTGDQVLSDSALVMRTLVGSGTGYRIPASVRDLTAGFTPGSTAEAAADTFAIPANAWDVTGESLVVRAWGIASANTNSKTVALKLGASGACTSGTAVGAVNFNQTTDTTWTAEWVVFRTGSSAQRAFLTAFAGTSVRAIDTSALTATRTETSVIDACVTVTNATTAGDLTVRGIIWDWR